MKKTPFKKKPQNAFKRTKGIFPRPPHKKRKAVAKRAKPTNLRRKLPSLKSLRTKCDNLLTPIIQKKYPYCLLQASQNCAKVTQVAHHHVHKSKSSRLRYDLQNLIPLCGFCHTMLHNDESFWGAKVAQLKGQEWFAYIEKAKHELVKTDRLFYTTHYETLLKEL